MTREENICQVYFFSLQLSTVYRDCYGLSLKVLKQKRNLILGLIQENSMEFQLQSVYLIYTWLIVYTTLTVRIINNRLGFIFLFLFFIYFGLRQRHDTCHSHKIM